MDINKFFSPMDERSKNTHEMRMEELPSKERALVRAIEEQVETIITEMEKLSCMLATNQCVRLAELLDKGPRTAMEIMGPWIGYGICSKRFTLKVDNCLLTDGEEL